jgi:hypothetical protein
MDYMFYNHIKHNRKCIKNLTSMPIISNVNKCVIFLVYFTMVTRDNEEEQLRVQ